MRATVLPLNGHQPCAVAQGKKGLIGPILLFIPPCAENRDPTQQVPSDGVVRKNEERICQGMKPAPMRFLSR